MKKVIFILLLAINTSSSAYEFPAPFKIDAINMSSPENFYFRVHDNSEFWHCHNGPKSPAWSYINENDPGAKGQIAILTAAYMAGKQVSLVTEGFDTAVGHVCHIVEFTVHD